MYNFGVTDSQCWSRYPRVALHPCPMELPTLWVRHHDGRDNSMKVTQLHHPGNWYHFKSTTKAASWICPLVIRDYQRLKQVFTSRQPLHSIPPTTMISIHTKPCIGLVNPTLPPLARTLRSLIIHNPFVLAILTHPLRIAFYHAGEISNELPQV